MSARIVFYFLMIGLGLLWTTAGLLLTVTGELTGPFLLLIGIVSFVCVWRVWKGQIDVVWTDGALHCSLSAEKLNIPGTRPWIARASIAESDW